jgi:hypothetical protein
MTALLPLDGGGSTETTVDEVNPVFVPGKEIVLTLPFSIVVATLVNLVLVVGS